LPKVLECLARSTNVLDKGLRRSAGTGLDVSVSAFETADILINNLALHRCFRT